MSSRIQWVSMSMIQVRCDCPSTGASLLSSLPFKMICGVLLMCSRRFIYFFFHFFCDVDRAHGHRYIFLLRFLFFFMRRSIKENKEQSAVVKLSTHIERTTSMGSWLVGTWQQQSSVFIDTVTPSSSSHNSSLLRLVFIFIFFSLFFVEIIIWRQCWRRWWCALRRF